MNTQTIILVDDEKPILRALKRELTLLCSDLSLEIKTFLHPDDALLYIRDHSEDVAVLVSDQKMPGMKGCDFIGYVREINSRIVSILLTAYTDTEDIIKSIRSGIFSSYRNPGINQTWSMRYARHFCITERKGPHSKNAVCSKRRWREGGKSRKRSWLPALKMTAASIFPCVTDPIFPAEATITTS